MTVASKEKKKFGLGAIIAIVAAVTVLGLVVVANLDLAGKAWSEEGSLIPAIGCYEIMTSIERLAGIKSIRLANALTDLSLCYARQTRLENAIRAQEQAIEIKQSLQGKNHPAVLILQANLASYMSKAGDHADAEQLLKATLLKAQYISPPAPPYLVGFILNALAETYLSQHRYKDAEPLAVQLQEIDERLLGSGNYPFYGKEILVEIYAKTGRFAEAEQLARQFDPAKNILLDKTVMVPAHEALGKVLILQGRKQEAKQEFDLAIDLLLKKYGDCDKTKYWRARYIHLLEQKDPFKE